jgi:uncharacterized membrane protein (DUF106 family)
MTKIDTQFEIDQLRKDKMISAMESAAFTLVAFLVLPVIELLLPVALKPYLLEVSMGVIIAVVLFWLSTVVVNIKRLKRIKSLEADLK